MISKKKKSEYGTVVDCEEAKILDYPEDGAPLVCQIKAGEKLKVNSKPNKNYYGVGISNSVVGFISKKYFKVE